MRPVFQFEGTLLLISLYGGGVVMIISSLVVVGYVFVETVRSVL